jgi:FdhE protein
VSATEPLSIEALGRRHPEWNVWLAVHRVVRSAVLEPAWTAALPADPPGDGATTPLATGAVFTVDARIVDDYVDALLDAAGARRLEAEPAIAMLDAAVVQDGERLGDIASAAGIDGAMLAALAPLAVSPLLQAGARAWQDRVSPRWDGAACPICGAWAAVMEARGVERLFRLRCARCGADWRAEPLRCPFCDERDHDKLAGLASEGTGDLRRVEACTVCLGYVKSVTTLAASAPEDVALLDLATVDLDVAAFAHGYARPPRPAFALGTRVEARPRAGLRALFGRRA